MLLRFFPATQLPSMISSTYMNIKLQQHIHGLLSLENSNTSIDWCQLKIKLSHGVELKSLSARNTLSGVSGYLHSA